MDSWSRASRTQVAGLLSFALALVLYLRTLHPSVAGGDSGELMVVATELGTPHPPGYPTFALYSKAASELIVRLVGPDAISLGCAMNAAHALLSAAAVGVIAAAISRRTGSVTAGLLGSALFGFAPNVWTYAVSTEVFPLNNLLSAVVVYLAIVFDEQRRRAPAVGKEKQSAAVSKPFVAAAAFALGLALTNQHTSVLFVVPVILYVFARHPPAWREPSSLAVNTAAFFAGLAPYLYLPLSNALVPSTNSWGRSVTWAGFRTHFFREEYGTFSLASKESTYKARNYGLNTRRYFGDIHVQVGTIGCAGAVAGALLVVYWGFQRLQKRSPAALERRPTAGKPARSVVGSARAPAGGGAAKVPRDQLQQQPPGDERLQARLSIDVLLLVTWALYTNFFNYLSNLPIEKALFYGVQQRFWIQPLLLVVYGCGLGWAAAWRLALAALGPKHQLGLRAVRIFLCVGLIALHVNAHFGAQDESENYYVRDFGHRLLARLPSPAVVLTKGDIMINSMRYCQVFERTRPDDVLILDQELLTYEWYNDNVRDYLRQLPASSPFRSLVLPGRHYYPNMPDRYDLQQLITANLDGQRRFFTATGIKEGDPSADVLVLRDFGAAQEVLLQPSRRALVTQRRAKGKPRERFAKEALQATVAAIDEIAQALPGADDLVMPPTGRYAPHTWEAVTTADTKSAYFNTGLVLMHIGDHLKAQEARGPPATAPRPAVSAALRQLVAASVLNASSSLVSETNAVLRAEGVRPSTAAYVASFRLMSTAKGKLGEIAQFAYETERNRAVLLQNILQILDTELRDGDGADATVRSQFITAALVPQFESLLTFPEHQSLSHSLIREVIAHFQSSL